jgi:hypothetical protein
MEKQLSVSSSMVAHILNHMIPSCTIITGKSGNGITTTVQNANYVDFPYRMLIIPGGMESLRANLMEKMFASFVTGMEQVTKNAYWTVNYD